MHRRPPSLRKNRLFSRFFFWVGGDVWNYFCINFSLRKHPFLLALRRWGRFARNVPGGEERGERDVFAGYINFTLQMKTSHTWRTGAATKLTARRLRTHSSKMASFTTSVISRANALALQGYKHCCHVMLHCPVEEKLFGFYPVKHAVLVSTVYTRKLGWYIYF